MAEPTGNNKKVTMLTDDKGNLSSMRLNSIIALFSSIGFGFITILDKCKGAEEGLKSEGVLITFGFLLAAFAPKALQKFAENKLPDKG